MEKWEKWIDHHEWRGENGSRLVIAGTSPLFMRLHMFKINILFTVIYFCQGEAQDVLFRLDSNLWDEFLCQQFCTPNFSLFIVYLTFLFKYFSSSCFPRDAEVNLTRISPTKEIPRLFLSRVNRKVVGRVMISIETTLTYRSCNADLFGIFIFPI